MKRCMKRRSRCSSHVLAGCSNICSKRLVQEYLGDEIHQPQFSPPISCARKTAGKERKRKREKKKGGGGHAYVPVVIKVESFVAPALPRSMEIPLRTVLVWRMPISDLSKEMDLILPREQRQGERMDWRIPPSLSSLMSRDSKKAETAPLTS